jgi:hypothetical protein
MSPSAVIAGLIPAIPIRDARPRLPKRDGRVKPSHDNREFVRDGGVS